MLTNVKRTSNETKITVSDQIYDDIKERLDIEFIPNIFLALKDKPALLNSSWALVKATLLSGELSRLYKEIIFAYTANVRQCDYCCIAHKALARQFGMHEQLLDYIAPERLKFIEPESLRLLLQFTDQLLRTQSGNSHDYMEDLIKRGVPRAHIDETIEMVGAASHMCMLANGFQLNKNIDDQFKVMLSA